MQNLHSGLDTRGLGGGRTLVPSLIVLCTAVFLFLVIAAGVALSATATAIDAELETWLHVRAIPLFTDAMVAISFLGAPSVLSIVAVAGGFLLFYRRRYADAATLSAVVLGGNFLNFCLKHLIQRGRPVFDDPLFVLPTYSFPSGHAMASTVFYGLLAIYASVNARRSSAVHLAAVAAVSMVALVCFSRIYLGLHYLSDVMGGISEGIAWLALSIIVSHLLSRSNPGARADAGS